jgi:hypothetical protein
VPVPAHHEPLSRGPRFSMRNELVESSQVTSISLTGKEGGRERARKWESGVGVSREGGRCIYIYIIYIYV